MSRKTLWTIGIIYTVITFILHNVLNTAIGEFLMQVSFFGLIIGVISFIFQYVSATIKQEIYNHKKKKENHDG